MSDVGQPMKALANDAEFMGWYVPLAKKLGINQNPDDPGHHYDYRSFYRDMQQGKVTPPDAPGGHFPSTYKTEGHPRTYLDDPGGRVYDTRTMKYLTGDAVPDGLPDSKDKPGFDAKRLMALGPSVMAMMRLSRW